MKTQSVQVGEVCQFVYGEALKEGSRRAGKVPVYGSNGVVGWHDKALTKGATIIIGRKGSIGEVNWSNGPCFPIDTTYYVEKADRPCDLRWLYYTLLKLDLTQLDKSAAVPGLNREDAYEQWIPFPDVPEQERIAALLDQADRLVRTRQFALEIREDFLPSAFDKLFGKANPQASTWPSVELVELCEREDDVRCGPFGTQLNKSEYRTFGVPLWGIKHVNAEFAFKTDEFLSKDKAQELDEYSLLAGDLVMTRKGTVGNCALYPVHFPRGIMHSDLLRIRLKAGTCSPLYVTHQLHNSRDIERQIEMISGGAIMAGINVGMLKSIKVQLPPLPIQQKFDALVERVERLRAVQREALRQADHLFESLLHEAFRTDTQVLLGNPGASGTFS